MYLGRFCLAGRKIYSLVPKINEPWVFGINYLVPQFNHDIDLFGREIGLLEQIINLLRRRFDLILRQGTHLGQD